MFDFFAEVFERLITFVAIACFIILAIAWHVGPALWVVWMMGDWLYTVPVWVGLPCAIFSALFAMMFMAVLGERFMDWMLEDKDGEI